MGFPIRYFLSQRRFFSLLRRGLFILSELWSKCFLSYIWKKKCIIQMLEICTKNALFHTQEEEITYPLLRKEKHFKSFFLIGIIGLYSCRIFQLLLISSKDTLEIDHTYAYAHTHTHTRPRICPIVGMPWCKAFWTPCGLKLYVLSIFCLYHS